MAAVIALGCDDTDKPAPSPSAVPSAQGGLDPELVAKSLNPKGLPPYSGPTGSVKGVVRVEGDPPAEADVEAEFTPNCESARAVHGKQFRVGESGALVDALVAVTGYQGYLPEKQKLVKVTGKGCSWGTQTLALTFGQQLEITSGDDSTYIPELRPNRMGVLFVAPPHQEGVTLTPEHPRSYKLVDTSHPFSTAAVFVLQYPTHDVTDEQGRFEIQGIPVGKVKINALLPPTMESVGRDIEIKAGQALELELVIHHRAA
ncbi:MAG: hypothetical protein KC766_20410, partial [Myxococcales bacterium]|nr:hypothetical protein [Myxococcales bacterium]